MLPPALTISNSAFCIYDFSMILIKKGDYSITQQQLIDLCNGEMLYYF
jgi:hypothetical protein